jgi:hypothetical protein
VDVTRVSFVASVWQVRWRVRVFSHSLSWCFVGGVCRLAGDESVFTATGNTIKLVTITQ